jgi:hypothetical protein
MRMGLPLTPISLLHPITPEDEVFAMKVKDEYNLPYDELCWLIRDIRDTMNDDYLAVKKDSRFRDTYNELFASDVEIKGITINTNKEDIFIKADSSLFDYFLTQIQKIQSELENKIDDQNHYLPAWSKINALLKTDRYISGTSLGPFQKNVVIGMFLFHFKFYKGEQLLTQIEFKTKQDNGELLGYDSYKHYLAEKAERCLKKFSFDPNI